MKKFLSVFILMAICGSSALAVTKADARKVLAEGEVLASEIKKDWQDNPAIHLVMRYEGKIFVCNVLRYDLFCEKFGEKN